MLVYEGVDFSQNMCLMVKSYNLGLCKVILHFDSHQRSVKVDFTPSYVNNNCQAVQNSGEMIVNVGNNYVERFNILLVGSASSGKKTLLRALLHKYVTKPLVIRPVVYSAEVASKVCIHEIADNTTVSSNGRIHFTIFQAFGYDDLIDNADAVSTIREDLLGRHGRWSHLNAQNMTENKRLSMDSRIHCILYFLSPNRIKDIDNQFFRQIGPLTPIVPILAKTDSMTVIERNGYLESAKRMLDNIVLQDACPAYYDFNFTENRVDGNGSEVMSSMAAPCPKIPTSRNTLSTPTPMPIDIDATAVPSLTNSLDRCDSDQEFSLMSVSYIGSCLRREATLSPENDSSICGAAGDLSSPSSPSCPLTPTSTADVEGYCVSSPPMCPSVASSTDAVPAVNTDEKICETYDKSVDACNREMENGITPSPLLNKIPVIFAIVACNSPSHLRQYSWGEIDMCNTELSDFSLLQQLLFDKGVHLWRLKSLTQLKTIGLSRSFCCLKGGRCTADCSALVKSCCCQMFTILRNVHSRPQVYLPVIAILTTAMVAALLPSCESFLGFLSAAIPSII